MRKIALITGISGQDGSFLTEFLLEKGYEVHGLVRRNSILWNYARLEHLHHPLKHPRLFLHYGDLTDSVSLTRVLAIVAPTEIYNLGAQSHVQVSFETPVYTALTTGIGVLNLLESVRSLGLKTKIYQAATSEMFSGDPKEAPQNERTPLSPRSPYGAAKVYATSICRVYRESYGMFIVNGILFNHESERRGESFVTRKITLGIRKILLGHADNIVLGNLDARRDWGYAPEYMEAAWKMLQQKKAEDYVIATGETHSVGEFAKEACDLAGLDFRKVIKTSSHFRRPNEVDYLCGDASKARKILGWKAKTKFRELVKIMLRNDLRGIMEI